MQTTTHKEIEEIGDLSATILLAAPSQSDANFSRTAVLIIEHNKDGAFGLVLNRPLDVTLDKLAPGLGARWGGKRPAPRAHQGGPVMLESAWMLHSSAGKGGDSRPVANDLAFTADAETIKGTIARPAGRFRLFLGYAGWGGGQLNDEIASGCWIVAPVDVDAIFSDEPDAVWTRMMSEIGIDPGMWCESSPSRH